jgi:hypothetical protein
MRDAFTVGNTVSRDDFFGRSYLIATLRDAITTGRDSTLLSGESRIGKISILRQLGYLTARTSDTTVFFDAGAGSPSDRLAWQLGQALGSIESLGGRAKMAGEKGPVPFAPTSGISDRQAPLTAGVLPVVPVS